MRLLFALLCFCAELASASSLEVRRLESLRVELIRKMSETTPHIETLKAVEAAYLKASDPTPFAGERLQAAQLLALRLSELQDLHERFLRAHDAHTAVALLKAGRGEDASPAALLSNDSKLFSEDVRLFREKARVALMAEGASWQAANDGWRVRRRWHWALALAGLLALLSAGGLAAHLRASGNRPSCG
ncbi:MAG TPA: hypothetical protein DCM05_10405 [Elusimicrobia bacterium]|nr:hypothetical protein [Elusimicrobiota bacterium]